MSYAPGFLRRLVPGWTNLSLRMKGLLVLSLPIASLLVSATLIFELEHEKTDGDQLRQHAVDIRAQFLNMFVVLISAESEVRNYGLNGQEDGLYAFGLTSAAIDPVFARVKDLIPDNAEQRARLLRTQELVHSRLEGLKELREYYHSGGHTGPAPADLRSRAKISPDVLLAVNEIATGASKLIQDKIKNNSTRQANFWSGIIGSSILGWVGGIIALFLTSRSTTRRMQGLEINASRMAEGLPTEGFLTATDELGRLSCAIEKAGAVIAARSDELKLALEGGEVLIWNLDPDSGRIGYDAGADKVHSAFPAELLPETVTGWIAMVHYDDRENVEQELKRITSESGTFQIEYRVVVRGGGIRWMLVRAQSHALGTSQRRLLGILADITARKAASYEIERQAGELRASRAALESQTRILQSILDSMSDGVVVADTQGKFIVFNPAARQILGVRSFGADSDQWSREHGLFLPDMVTLYPAEQLPFRRAIRGDVVDGAEIFARPAGVTEGRWLSITARPLREEAGEVRGGVLVIRDVTSQKQAAAALELAKREAEAANQAKSEFLSRMSHELRTPLNSILGFAQLLEMETLGEQGTDNVYHILKGGYHLLDLINEILDLARIESGRLALSSEPVRMREALKDALDLVRPLAIEKGVSIHPDIALRCNHHVQADRQRLKQVLLNLLSNAIKFNRNGGSVVLSCEEVGDSRLRIEVLDTGSGISPEGLKRIFTPFERLGTDLVDPGGTGLGLALSKRLIEGMGGTIGVESSLGFGSRFFIELSVIEDPLSTLDQGAVAVLIDSASMYQRGTVLYIEDNSSNLRLVERIFAHRPGVRLLSAMQGFLGLDLAEFHKPDWILLDLHLPDVSGEEVLRRLRANPKMAHIPITILSADATAGQINRLMEAGANDYLTKPLDVRKFINLLDKAISGSAPVGSERGVYAERDYSE
jgi:signal transduction histidine kinase/ActR/RegA family two-component response regulator/CHASE3 domain sensor protein